MNAPPTESAVDAAPWRHLDGRMVVVAPAQALVKLLPVLVVLLVLGRGDPIRLWSTLAAAILIVIYGLVRWRTTRYRITPERVEMRSGLLNRQRTSVPRDRVRTVDLTAGPLHRLFRLVVVTVHAADSHGGIDQKGLKLDAVNAAEGERLRRELLDRAGVTASVAGREQATPPAETAQAEVIARLDWAWLRFAPLTFSSLAGIGAVVAAGFNLAGELDIDPRDIDAVDAATDRLAAAPLWLAVGLVGLVLLVIAIAGSIVLFVERWWGYQLTREPDGTLRVRRGLLTRRSLSVSEERLRGAAVHEPLLLRLGRGAQARALSTGLGREGESGILQPPAPRAEAHRVASATLRDPTGPTLTPLPRHSRAARSRRFTRALLPTLVLVGVAVAVERWVGWLWPVTVALLPLMGLLALDRYRNLGHLVTPRYLISRIGGLNRRTVVLQRSGIIGWRIRQSPFQRRAALVTVEAVTAAGKGGYAIPDVDIVQVDGTGPVVRLAHSGE